MVSRVSAMHGPSGTNFVTSVQENDIREIQARAERDGAWSVSGLENGERTGWSFVGVKSESPAWKCWTQSDIVDS